MESAVAGTFCHTWINPLGQKERSTQKLKEEASWLAKAELPDVEQVGAGPRLQAAG